MSSPSTINIGAGFGIRALAHIIDIILGMLLGLLAGFIAGFILSFLDVTGRIAPGWIERAQGSNPLGMFLSLVGGLLYRSLGEGLYGATLGKLICRLRVLSPAGVPCNLLQAIKRGLAFYWDALFFGLVGYHSMQKSPLNQRYGDLWAKTIVAKTKDIPIPVNKSPWLFILSFWLGTTCWLTLIVISLYLKAK